MSVLSPVLGRGPWIVVPVLLVLGAARAMRSTLVHRVSR
jgi:hypothetical protein